jgi:hypothetical protein
VRSHQPKRISQRLTSARSTKSRPRVGEEALQSGFPGLRGRFVQCVANDLV